MVTKKVEFSQAAKEQLEATPDAAPEPEPATELETPQVIDVPFGENHSAELRGELPT